MVKSRTIQRDKQGSGAVAPEARTSVTVREIGVQCEDLVLERIGCVMIKGIAHLPTHLSRALAIFAYTTMLGSSIISIPMGSGSWIHRI
jgi:hypothetical protein